MPGYHAVVATLKEGLYVNPPNPDFTEETNYRAHQSTSLIYHSILDSVKAINLPGPKSSLEMPKFFIAYVSEAVIVSPVVAVPYHIDEVVQELDWLFVEPLDAYEDIFSQCMRDVVPSRRPNR